MLQTNRIVLIVYFAVFQASMYGQISLEDREKPVIAKHQIKQKIEWEYSSQNSKGIKSSETRYNVSGNVITKINYRSTGDTLSVILNKYDGKGRLVDYSRYDARRKAYAVKQHMTYNAKGNLVSESGIIGANGQFANTYTYDAKGNLIEILFKSEGALTEKRVIVNSTNAKEIKVYDKSNVLVARFQKKFDAKGNLLEEIKLNKAGEQEHRFVYKYDGGSNVVEESKYYSGKLTVMIKSKYNAQNSLTEIVYVYPNNEKQPNNMYQYDDTGKLIQEKSYNDQTKKYMIKEYTYNLDGTVASMSCTLMQSDAKYTYKYTYNK